MTDTNQLPPLPTPKFTETIRGVPCITVTEHKHLMRAYALQARAPVQGEPSWWMRETDEGAEWTDTAPLVLSGWTPLYTTPQAAPATQAEVTDEQISAAYLAWCKTDGTPESFARAILALRPEWVPMTDEQISLEAHNADDRDWNDLRFRSSWHEGFLEGARFAESHHGITAQAKKEAP